MAIVWAEHWTNPDFPLKLYPTNIRFQEDNIVVKREINMQAWTKQLWSLEYSCDLWKPGNNPFWRLSLDDPVCPCTDHTFAGAAGKMKQTCANRHTTIRLIAKTQTSHLRKGSFTYVSMIYQAPIWKLGPSFQKSTWWPERCIIIIIY